MKLKQKVKVFLVSAIVMMGLFISFASELVSAGTCAGVTTSIISCSQTGEGVCPDKSTVAMDKSCPDGSTPVLATSNTGVWGILILAINILTAGVGIAAIGGIVYGAVLYTSAGGSQEQVKKAVGVLTNVVIGIVAYALMWSVLNFLIPGGVFN